MLRLRPPTALTFVRHASRKYTRQERIDQAKHAAQTELYALDTQFDLFNERVSRVVDLGYAPGTWLEYARVALSALHNTRPERLHDKCVLLGVDVLFARPPPGTFCTQGNVFSQRAHDTVVGLLKDAAARVGTGAAPRADPLGGLAAALGSMSLAPPAAAPAAAYQAHLVLSDLAAPFLQEAGFYSNTQSKPYVRSNRSPELRQAYTHAAQAAIDLAEAALLLSGRALGQGGTLVLRLARVDLADPELALLETRLRRVFGRVARWAHDGRVASASPCTATLFFVCKDKLHSSIDKYAVFDVQPGPLDAP